VLDSPVVCLCFSTQNVRETGAQGYRLAGVLVVLTLRRGSDRAISHWAHCMQTLHDSPLCGLGNGNMQAYRNMANPLRWLLNGTGFF
jgi:hypothetical protein